MIWTIIKNFISSGNKTLSLLIISIVLLVLLFGQYKITQTKLDKQIQRNEILYNTISSIKDTATLYQIKWNDSIKLWTAKVKEVQMEKSSFEVLYSEQANQIAKLKLKNVQSVATINTYTTDSIRVPVYVDSLKALHADYKDEFINIKTTIFRDNKADIKYESRDSFTLINNEAYKKRFLFFKWGKYSNYQLLCKNPNTQISSLKVVTIVNK